MSATSASVQPFPLDALETNRSGRLSDAQRQSYSKGARLGRKNEFTGSFVFIAMGLLILFGVDSSKPAYLHYGFPVLMFLAAGFFVFRSTAAGDPLTQDLRSSKVLAVEGPMTKWIVQGRGRAASSYWLQIQHERLHLSHDEYHAIPEGGIVRAYYLPKTRYVVNFEQLADRPLPAGTVENPMGVLKTAFTGMLSGAITGDRTKQAEAKATMAALEHAEAAVLKPHAAVPPAPGQTDPRPLAEAILGTWQLGPMKVEFAPGGVATLHPPFGPGRTGHWSVDASGKLHLDAIEGREQATDAWVVGNSLTVSMDGQALTAHRVG